MTNTAAQPVAIDSHQMLDRYNLLYHCEVAQRLQAEPQTVLERAKSNIQRWMPAHAGSFSEHALLEWKDLLDRLSLSELIAVITEDSDEGQRLRQSTPFTGLLTEMERDALWRHCAQGNLSRTYSASERG